MSDVTVMDSSTDDEMSPVIRVENTKPIVASTGSQQKGFAQDALQALSQYDSQMDPVPLRTFVPSQLIQRTSFAAAAATALPLPVASRGSTSLNGSGVSAAILPYPQPTKPRVKATAPQHSTESLLKKLPSGADTSVYAIMQSLGKSEVVHLLKALKAPSSSWTGKTAKQALASALSIVLKTKKSQVNNNQPAATEYVGKVASSSCDSANTHSNTQAVLNVLKSDEWFPVAKSKKLTALNNNNNIMTMSTIETNTAAQQHDAQFTGINLSSGLSLMIQTEASDWKPCCAKGILDHGDHLWLAKRHLYLLEQESRSSFCRVEFTSFSSLQNTTTVAVPSASTSTSCAIGEDERDRITTTTTTEVLLPLKAKGPEAVHIGGVLSDVRERCLPYWHSGRGSSLRCEAPHQSVALRSIAIQTDGVFSSEQPPTARNDVGADYPNAQSTMKVPNFSQTSSLPYNVSASSHSHRPDKTFHSQHLQQSQHQEQQENQQPNVRYVDNVKYIVFHRRKIGLVLAQSVDRHNGQIVTRIQAKVAPLLEPEALSTLSVGDQLVCIDGVDIRPSSLQPQLEYTYSMQLQLLNSKPRPLELGFISASSSR